MLCLGAVALLWVRNCSTWPPSLSAPFVRYRPISALKRHTVDSQTGPVKSSLSVKENPEHALRV